MTRQTKRSSRRGLWTTTTTIVGVARKTTTTCCCFSNLFFCFSFEETQKSLRIQKRQSVDFCVNKMCFDRWQLGVVVAFFLCFFIVHGHVFHQISLRSPSRFSVRCKRCCSTSLYILLCGEKELRRYLSFVFINNIENNNNNNKAFFIPTRIKARRDNNFVLKHATDARRRKFSNDDGYVERARE